MPAGSKATHHADKVFAKMLLASSDTASVAVFVAFCERKNFIHLSQKHRIILYWFVFTNLKT